MHYSFSELPTFRKRRNIEVSHFGNLKNKQKMRGVHRLHQWGAPAGFHVAVLTHSLCTEVFVFYRSRHKTEFHYAVQYYWTAFCLHK